MPCALFMSVDFDETIKLTIVIIKEIIGLRINATITHSVVGSGA
jgi:hypothetical protein